MTNLYQQIGKVEHINMKSKIIILFLLIFATSVDASPKLDLYRMVDGDKERVILKLTNDEDTSRYYLYADNFSLVPHLALVENALDPRKGKLRIYGNSLERSKRVQAFEILPKTYVLFELNIPELRGDPSISIQSWVYADKECKDMRMSNILNIKRDISKSEQLELYYRTQGELIDSFQEEPIKPTTSEKARTPEVE